MAMYNRLLLSAGGGIVSAAQQAQQAENTGTVFIGLGGTGVTALRRIKTEVYSRLAPDNPDDPNPEYKHIRFLAVDTDKQAAGVALADQQDANGVRTRALSDAEFCFIGDEKLKTMLEDPLALQAMAEFHWVSSGMKMNVMGVDGAGGVRQAGRALLMNRCQEFRTKLNQAITDAMLDLNDDPKLNIHILTGLSGGTGAGTFLDVCYLARAAAQGMNGRFFGYFFLPDMNLRGVDNLTAGYIKKNGYAAMQELDYCMRLADNGGSFRQSYRGVGQPIEWKGAPVDIAHLVSGLDADGNLRTDPWRYAMGAVAEYALSFLTASADGFGTQSHLSNFNTHVGQGSASRRYGMNLRYAALGAGCAMLPLRQINTYLASEVFAAFARVKSQLPLDRDTDAFAEATLGRSMSEGQSLYEALLQEAFDGTSSWFESYESSWKWVRQNGNRDMVEWYADQWAAKIGAVEENVAAMGDEANEGSLIGRIKAYLDNEVVPDLERGPIFASGLLASSKGHNLLNVIDGLLEENETKRLHAANQNTSQDYDAAKAEFEANAGMFNGSKLFAAYNGACEAHHENLLWCGGRNRLGETVDGVYDRIAALLRRLRTQVEQANAQRYGRLARIFAKLSKTFEANRATLAAGFDVDPNDFVKMLMTVDELKPAMDAEIDDLRIPNVLSDFMRMMLDEQEEWKSEEEARIAKLVTDFFVKKQFPEYASRSLESFLADKYGTSNAQVIANNVYKDWVNPLATAQARPLFPFDGTVMNQADAGFKTDIMVPTASAAVTKAAQMVEATDPHRYTAHATSLTDRIFVMSNANAIALSAYSQADEYMAAYYTGNVGTPGQHYYEDDEGRLGLPFGDWRSLPPLRPQSLIDLEHLSYGDSVDQVSHLSEIRELFAAARRFGMVAQNGDLFTVDSAVLTRYEEELRAAEAAIERVASPADFQDASAGLDLVRQNVERVTLEAAGERLDARGLENRRWEILEDMFVVSPALQKLIRGPLERMVALSEGVERAQARLEERDRAVNESAKLLDQFCDALFVAALSFEDKKTIVFEPLKVDDSGRNVERDPFGETLCLVKWDKERFPFCEIPPYQAFRSFCALDGETRDQIARVSVVMHQNEELERQGFEAVAPRLSDKSLENWRDKTKDYTERDEIVTFLKRLAVKFKQFRVDVEED